MTEGRGTGIPKILRTIRNNDSPTPVFHTDDDRTFFLVEFSIHPVFLKSISQEPDAQVTGEVTGEIERLLSVMDGDMKRRDIQAALG